MSKKVEKKEVKKTAVAKPKMPEKFTQNCIIDYVAVVCEIPKKKAKEAVEAYLCAISAGVLSGSRVPVGAIGKVFIKIRPASPKRKGRNPLTGEEITIPAKPATKVPKASFAKAFKESCKKAKIGK
ncbi:MAG: Bacterial nucleoid DNA-binding protein [Parcubacteria group bacterium GW2011_GWF2_46_8]|nr:MAG: Bacterial nucleoid DNA-binding protein [Parcubacteria group bacterium GW2011_GWF2_46_8]